MTKYFCDVCGKELTTLERMNAYNVTITSKNRMCYAPWSRGYSEVCEDCAEKIADAIYSLKKKEKTNG